jgi:hypothetical protein
VLVIASGYFAYKNTSPSEVKAPTDITYKNAGYGFELTLPVSWQGYSVENKTWNGTVIDTGEQKYSGTEVLINNPKNTVTEHYQAVPIMVFTHNVWDLVSQEKVAVSAAPIGPAKVGENAKYVFATPPRWYGFTDDLDFQEAVDIVKTFKAF